MSKGQDSEIMQCSEITQIKQNKDGSTDTIQCARNGADSYTFMTQDFIDGEWVDVPQQKWLCNHHKNAFLKSWSMGATIAHSERCIAGENGETLQRITIESKAKAEELDPDGSLRKEIRAKVNARIKAKQEKIQAENEAALLLEVSMFRETLPLLWRMIRRKLFDDRELSLEEQGWMGSEIDGEIHGAIDGPIPRMAEIQRHIEWFIETYDLEWPDINLAEMWDMGDGEATKKWRKLMCAAHGDAYHGDVDEFGDMIDR